MSHELPCTDTDYLQCYYNFKGKVYIRVGLLVATTDMGAQVILGHVNNKRILIVLTSSVFYFEM